MQLFVGWHATVIDEMGEDWLYPLNGEWDWA